MSSFAATFTAAFLGVIVATAIIAAAPSVASWGSSLAPPSRPGPPFTWCHHIPIKLDNGTTIQAPICGYWSQSP